MSRVNPDDLISYGPGANCVLDQSSPYYCPVSYSVYQYRPSLAANIIFLVIFFLFMIVHVWQGLKWRTWWYMGAMVLGCICEVLGYAGRIMLWQNPFDFNGFMLQIILITFGPAFFSAGIYFTLSKIVTYLGTEYSRLSPKAYYYIFIPCDLISLALQGAGGGMSSSSSGSSQTGVDIAIAGLSFQVVSLFIFIVLALDFAIRYIRGRKTAASQRIISTKFKTFIGFLSLAIVLILVRCSYRIAELHEGYMAPPDSLIHDQATFIGLEGVAIVIAVICLTIGHPGPVFAESNPRPKTLEHLSESGSDNRVPQTIPSEK